MSLDYTMRSIPTMFNGIQYRSRLEARWAAFFNSMGWPFTYEPMDLCGWAPDFLLRANAKKPLFVEIKPIVTWENSVAEKAERAMPPGVTHDLLICGLGIEYPGGMPMIGWMGKWKKDHWFWDDATITRFQGPVSLTEWETNQIQISDSGNVQSAWNHACNAVQWKGQRS